MSSSNLWAVEIQRMTPSERANTRRFSPYCVTPDGALRLPFEDIRRKGPRGWPVGRAPGWTKLTLSDGNEYSIWRPLGSEFYFSEQEPQTFPHERPFIVHVPPEARSSLASISSAELLNLVLRGEAFPFCGRVFILPKWEQFTMNSMQYHVENMESLAVFVGYRGQSKQYDEKLTPGLYRKRNSPSEAKQQEWILRSRVAGNILKQRFLENENKPLTGIESVGILQHHTVIGPTDMVDFSYDLNVAKWFALNEFTDGAYRQKEFDRSDGRHGSCVYTATVRVTGMIPLKAGDAEQIAPGVTFELWKDFGGLRGVPQQAAVPPWNLAPIWSEHAKRQKGFGLHGIGPGEVDAHGSILGVTEHLFHPTSHADGWDSIGGPELVINGQRFTFNQDSSHLAKHLFPEEPKWLKDTFCEIRRVVEVE